MDKLEAAEKFAELIKTMAKEGCIESLSIKIKDFDSEELFKLAQTIGIYELSVTAIWRC